MLQLPGMKQRRWIYLVLLAVCYLSFSQSVGLIHAADAVWYEQGSVRVSPLYPMLLAFFRLLFGEGLYRYAVMLFQELLLAYAIFSLTDALERVLRLSWFGRAACCGWLAFMLYAFRLVVIGGDTETFFCNAMLTEGVAYPLYLLFIKYWFLAVRERDGRLLLGAALFSLLLTCTRGQFYWLLLMLLIGFLVIRAGKDKTGRRSFFRKGLGILAAYALITLGLSTGYHLAATGSATGTTLGAEVTLSAVLYDCDENAADFLPEGSEARTVLGNTLRESGENGWLVGAVEGDWVARYRHYENSFDEVRRAFLGEVAKYNGIDNHRDMPGDLLARSAGMYAKYLPRLLRDSFAPYIRTRLLNLVAGLLRSNSIMGWPGAALSASVYLACMLLLLLTRKREACAGARLFLGMTLL